MNAKATFVPALLQLTVVEPAKVVLELTVEQAETLRAIHGRIGGSPLTTRRADMVAINRALRNAGIEKPQAEFDGDLGGANFIYFKDNA